MAHLLLQAFRGFDPFTGDMPEYFTGEFQDIADRARDILKNRTAKEIQDAYHAINLHLENARFRSMKDFLRMPANSISIPSPSPVLEFLGCMPSEKLDTSRDIPNATWAEYFAVLALGLIAHARALTSDLRQYERFKKDEIEFHRLREAGEFAILATEAITIGASLLKEFPIIPSNTESRLHAEIIKDETRRNTQIQAREAANKKHAESPYAPLRTRARELYLQLLGEKPEISNAKASKVIWSQFAKTEKEILQSEEPERTIEKWIAEFKKDLKRQK